jgi:hypothetical protein
VDALAEVAIIIPLAPGETTWRELLTDLMPLPAGAQIVLVRAAGVPLALPPMPPGIELVQYEACAGRALQMNLGARHARGRWLWFLHGASHRTRCLRCASLYKATMLHWAGSIWPFSKTAHAWCA